MEDWDNIAEWKKPLFSKSNPYAEGWCESVYPGKSPEWYEKMCPPIDPEK